MEPQPITREEYARFRRGIFFSTSLTILLGASLDLGYHFFFEKPIGNIHLSIVGIVFMLGLGSNILIIRKPFNSK